jgi:hypothetical protein
MGADASVQDDPCGARRGRRKRAEGATLGFSVACALYEDMRARRPDWSSPEERAQDLEDHIRLAAALRHASIRR